MHRTISAGLAAAALLAAADRARPSHPGWARKYGVSCFTCHAPVPKLNDFGRRFRANGYQIPGTIEATPIWQQKDLPLGLMLHEMFVRNEIDNKMAMDSPGGIPAGRTLTASSFENLSIEMFAGGTIDRHLSFFGAWEFETERDLEDGRFVTSVGVEVDQAMFLYNNILDSGFGHLNARIGLFELAIPFSQIRKIGAEGNRYLIYDVKGTQDGFVLGRPQLGAALFGRYEGFEYELAVVNGTNDEIDTNDGKDLFVRAAYSTYAPFDPLSVARAGVFGYFGRENLGSNVTEDNTTTTRVGVDLSFQLETGHHLFAQWVYGKNNDTDGSAGGDQELRFNGGFVELDAPILAERLFAFTRYGWVDIGEQWNVNPMTVRMMGNVDLVQKYTLGLRYHFSPSVFTHLEWWHMNNMVGHPPGTNEAAVAMNMDMDALMLMFAAAF